MSAIALEPRARAGDAGRICPLDYRYSPAVFDRAPEIVRRHALRGRRALRQPRGARAPSSDGRAPSPAAARSCSTATSTGSTRAPAGLPQSIARRRSRIARCAATSRPRSRAEDSGAGCGCAYPVDVSDAVVSRSNEILERAARRPRRRFPTLRERLAALPMHLVAQVGERASASCTATRRRSRAGGFAQRPTRRPSAPPLARVGVRRAARSMSSRAPTPASPALRDFALPAGRRPSSTTAPPACRISPARASALVTRIATTPLAARAPLRPEPRRRPVERWRSTTTTRVPAALPDAWPAGSPARTTPTSAASPDGPDYLLTWREADARRHAALSIIMPVLDEAGGIVRGA